MKRLSMLVLPVAMAVMCAVVFGQGGGAPGGGAPGGGGQGRGGGGGGRGGGGRAPAAPATGPIADWVTKMVENFNKGDAAALNAMLTADAQWVDEDGHYPPASAWVGRLTTGAPRTLTVLTAPSALTVKEMGDTAIAMFNFSMKETVTPRGQTTGTPNEMLGIASVVLKKDGADWKAFLIHAAARGTAIQAH
jgi:ketosteroid isomerase-like protein